MTFRLISKLVKINQDTWKLIRALYMNKKIKKFDKVIKFNNIIFINILF